MAPVSVISFADAPMQRTARRLADLPDRVVEGDPRHEVALHFESPDKALTVGSWTSSPGKWHAFVDKDEFCYITEGHCELIDETGTVNTYRTGDAFLIPNGFRGYWNVIETTTKYFVIRLCPPE